MTQMCTATLAVKTDRGVGKHEGVEEEIVHISYVVGNSSAMTTSFLSTEPYLYHSSRTEGLKVALALKESGALEQLGLVGASFDLRIPAIPFGGQEKDTGIHMSIYNRPGDADKGADYDSPPLEKALALVGKTISFSIGEDFKLLNGNEANDEKVGGCYYLSLGCDQQATDAANEVKQALGLDIDNTQRFHLSIAVVSPSWMPCHTQSVFARSCESDSTLQKLKDSFKLLRHGHSCGFPGWNCNEVTEWTTNANAVADMNAFNGDIDKQIKALDSAADDFEESKKALQGKKKQFKDIGFAKPVGPSENVKSLQTPSTESQVNLLSAVESDAKDVNKQVDKWKERVYTATLVVNTDKGIGMHEGVEEEVVHISYSLGETPHMTKSTNPREPYMYHSSRSYGLKRALAFQKQGMLEQLGLVGKSYDVRVPGIPFEQEKDTGIHMSIYNRPGDAKDGGEYTSPPLEKALALRGKGIQFTVGGDLKILNGSVANEEKVGGCYYLSMSCDKNASDAANEIKKQLGIPIDENQRFHLSMAIVSPSWVPCHTKSVVAREKGEAMLVKIRNAFKIFRHGHPCGFPGWNGDEVTGWTTHAEKSMAIGAHNTKIKDKIKELDDEAADYAMKKKELEAQLHSINSLGFCKPVGTKEGIKKLLTPPTDAQEKLLEAVAEDCKSMEDLLQGGSGYP